MVSMQAKENSARRPVSRVLSPPLSGRWMAIHLGRPLPDASRNLPGQRCENTLAGANPACRPYSVLLPVGFTMPPLSPGARCALTAPFHPCRPTANGGSAVCFLWHFPWGCPRRALPGTVFPWSPDFPPPKPFRDFGGRPSSRLTPIRLNRWFAGSSPVGDPSHGQ